MVMISKIGLIDEYSDDGSFAWKGSNPFLTLLRTRKLHKFGRSCFIKCAVECLLALSIRSIRVN